MSLSFDDQPRPGSALMARDAARLQALEADPSAGPSLLWFTWDRPTISLGRLQDPVSLELEVARDGAGEDVAVVVRPTGGRAVFHVDEWTYGAVVPLDHPVLGGPLAAACRAITGLIAEALEEAYGVPARLAADVAGEVEAVETSADRAAASPSPTRDPACFARAHGYEIVVEGRKLAGSAQRRGSRALLQQGSLLVGPGHERLARLVRGGGGAAAERALARRAVTLEELLGARPDPAPFRAAVARGWERAVASPAFVSQASGQAEGVPLDSLRVRS